MKRISGIVFILALILIMVVPPLTLCTCTYPLAVVNGNSMYPIYKNGEMVIFSLNGVNVNDIPNGTDIVYVQTETGIPMLSAITAHPIAHQVIKRIVNQYGKVYYQTKGINNLYPDPLLVPADHILGVVVSSEPYAGYPFIYATEPSGMIMMIGFIVIMYVGSVEKAFNRQKMRQKFIGELYKLVEERKLTEKRFNEIKMVIENAESYGHISDPLLRNLNKLAKKNRIGKFHLDQSKDKVEITDGKERYLLWEKKILSYIFE